MRKYIPSFFALLVFICSCKEDVDTSARYVFKDHTVSSYLDAHADVYSEYVELTKHVSASKRSKSSVYQLLAARGNYTCLAPTNEAIHNYLQTLVDQGLISEPSWSAFTDSSKLDSIRNVIVLNTVIDGQDFNSQRLYIADISALEEKAELPLAAMSEHKLVVYHGLDEDNNDVLMLDSCVVDANNRDIPLTNGLIHQIHKVVAPKDESAARYLQQILDQQIDGYLMFAKALQACNLFDTLSVWRDEEYEQLYQDGKIEDMKNYMDKGGYDMTNISSDPHAYAPQHRLIGFTLFCETDDFWRQQGIDPAAPNAVEKLQDWIYDNHMYLSDGGYVKNKDYTSPKNMLYQWTTYHILPMRLPANKLVYHCNELGYNPNSTITQLNYTLPVYEWYAVYGGDRLLKLFESKESLGVYINRFPHLRNGVTDDGHEQLPCDPDKVGCKVLKDDAVSFLKNAYIYPLDAPLAYTDETRENLGRERLRFDLFSLFPESMTNGIRRADSKEGRWQHVYFPRIFNEKTGKEVRYFENMWILNDETYFIHYNGYSFWWANYCGDEDKVFGQFDMMVKLPPVPKRGTYELRYKLLATAARGVVQIYFGTNPESLPVAGIPVNMEKNLNQYYGDGTDWALIEDKGKDEDQILEIYHNLRNYGVMKSAKHEGENNGTTARDKSNCMRHILARQTLDPSETYYLRMQSVLDNPKKELYLDFFELCPKEVYDNPEQPEDIW